MDDGHSPLFYPATMQTFAAARRISDRYPVQVDAGIAFVLGVLILIGLRINWPGSTTVQPWQAIVLTIWLTAPLAWRRRAPQVAMLVMIPALILFEEADLPEYIWAVNVWWLAFFSAGVYGADRWRNQARFVGSVLWMGYLWYIIMFQIDYGATGIFLRLAQLLALSSNFLVLGAAWWFGDTVRISRARETELAARTVKLERDRAEEEAQAVLAERLRIARELHDVVAHHVSVIGVQAGAARRVLEKHPERAQVALSSIEETSRVAVQELQNMLGLLRDESAVRPRTVQPGLAQLDELTTQVRTAGLPAEVRVTGEPRLLSPGVELSIYRIIQEALTNALKHSGAAKVAVDLAYRADGLDLAIIDNGPNPPPPGHQIRGNGLIGMQERVTLLGGTMHAGYQPGTGFAVRVHLPFGGGYLA